uniref:Uncharacterized protein n=1 Tax=uncultured Desulfobacterium sp. TaxID=201089 RepID=E1YB53_9BACT|nr:unknown protein [uncultured Desulfobacterium sp.]
MVFDLEFYKIYEPIHITWNLLSVKKIVYSSRTDGFLKSRQNQEVY